MYENVKILSRKEVEVPATSSWRRSSGRRRVQPHHLLAPSPHSSRERSDRFDRARATGCKQPSDAIDRVTGATLWDPRSRLLKSGDGERGFAFTRKNLCHSFNGAAHRYPAFPRDCNARFDSLRGRINFILRLSSCTRALRRFSPEECSAFRESLNVVDRRVAAFLIFFLCPSDRSRKIDSLRSGELRVYFFKFAHTN